MVKDIAKQDIQKKAMNDAVKFIKDQKKVGDPNKNYHDRELFIDLNLTSSESDKDGDDTSEVMSHIQNRF